MMQSTRIDGQMSNPGLLPAQNAWKTIGLLHVIPPKDMIDYVNTLKQNHKENSFVHGRMRVDMSGARSSSGEKKHGNTAYISTRQAGLLYRDHGQIRKKGVPNVCLQFPL
jgi:hypothetical protein